MRVAPDDRTDRKEEREGRCAAEHVLGERSHGPSRTSPSSDDTKRPKYETNCESNARTHHRTHFQLLPYCWLAVLLLWWGRRHGDGGREQHSG